MPNYCHATLTLHFPARFPGPALAGFFSPLYNYLFGFHVFGLGFLTTLLFVFGVGGALPLPLLPVAAAGSCCWQLLQAGPPASSP